MSLINYKIVHEYTMTFFFAIYYTLFCHYSVLWQNVLWLIEEKDGCWVVDGAVVFLAEGGQFESRHA